MKRLYPKGQITWLIDRLHVSESNEDIRLDILKRTEKWPEAQRRMAVKDALARHQKNREMYNYIMKGI